VSKLRSENQKKVTRYKELRLERDSLASKIQRERSANRNHNRAIKKLERNLEKIQLAKSDRSYIKGPESLRKADKPLVLASVTEREVKKREAKSMDLPKLLLLNELNQP